MTDEIDVLIEDEPPVVDPLEIGDPPKPETKTKGAAPVTDPNEGVDILKRQLEASQAEAAANARRAATAEQTVVRAQTEVQETNLQLIENAIGAHKQTIEVIQGEIADAMAAGDFNAFAQLQTKLARVTNEQMTLENGLDSLKNAPKPTAPTPPPADDPVERMASQLTAKSAAWVRAHPDFARDPRKQQRLLAAHNLVVTEDNAPELDSPDYFAAIEQRLGVGAAPAARARAPADDDTEVALSDGARAQGGRGTDTSPPAAPARNGGGGAPRTVRLTQAEVEAAEMSGMTPAEYAIQKDKIARANRDRLN